jgi:hypothetical protein
MKKNQAEGRKKGSFPRNWGKPALLKMTKRRRRNENGKN